MEAQESCGRTWQFRIFLGSFLAVTVKTSPFLHGMHRKTFHLLPPCMDHENYLNLEWLVRFLIIIDHAVPILYLLYMILGIL
ncbi:hypothetical protein NC653_040166 [Populus alba x Populus x berolinensis]|uniref:Uncharacterized protein n=1 Tax=Populus alba x Populus x berolinensis TaxID=444605 RepID=A0AAD6LD24_9ROSI|nr:hypothetical protein NC653_040166 [Populus alba x Populus x berolinensis]